MSTATAVVHKLETKDEVTDNSHEELAQETSLSVEPSARNLTEMEPSDSDDSTSEIEEVEEETLKELPDFLRIRESVFLFEFDEVFCMRL